MHDPCTSHGGNQHRQTRPWHSSFRNHDGWPWARPVDSESLGNGAPGEKRVCLSVSPQRWFDAYSSLGETLHLSRNRASVLGRLGVVPALVDWRNEALPRDHRGEFAPNLAEYAALYAMNAASPFGPMIGLETRDPSGFAFERVLVSTQSQRKMFECFVTKHRSHPDSTLVWYPPNHVWSLRRRLGLVGRIQWLRERASAGEGDVVSLPDTLPANVLSLAAESRIPLRVAQYGQALIRVSTWTPQSQAWSDDGAAFFHGDDVGFHIHQRGIGSAWLWKGECACCGKQRLAVEVGDDQDQIALALQSGDEDREQEWRQLIESCDD